MTAPDPEPIPPAPRLTVFHDGACPLCQREIAALRAVDTRGRLGFVDVSAPQSAPFCPLPQARLLARFHVQLADGQMLDGGRAFTEAWGLATGLAPLVWLGRFAPSRWALDRLYDLFLRVRPYLQRLAGGWS